MAKPNYSEVMDWIEKTIASCTNRYHIASVHRLMHLFREHYIPEGLSGLMRSRYGDYDMLMEKLLDKAKTI